MLAQVDQQLYGDETAAVTRLDVLDAFSDYVADELKRGIALKHMTRHILGVFQGVPGARQFRRVISEQAHRPGAGLEVLAARSEERRVGHKGSIRLLWEDGNKNTDNQ